MKTLLALAVLALGGMPSLLADQKEGEAARMPVKVTIVDERKIPDWGGDPFGNVEVTYANDATERLTKTANAAMPRTSNGLIGWVDATEGKKGSTKLAVNDRGTPIGSRIILYKEGKVTVTIQAALPFIEMWGFASDGKHLVVKSRASHGPATVQRFVCADGSKAGEVKAYDEKAPAWAKPFAE